jgi:hypothetical protein
MPQKKFKAFSRRETMPRANTPRHTFLTEGLLEAGNIDLLTRPVVESSYSTRHRPRGSATVRSMSFNQGGIEILVPTVHDDGYIMSNDEAWEQYNRTGRHLGKFSSPEAATLFSRTLSADFDQGRIPGFPASVSPLERKIRADKANGPVSIPGLGIPIPSPSIDMGTFDEQKFQEWYAGWAAKSDLDTDPDNPLHKYDYRAAFSAGEEPVIDPVDGLYHWPSAFKSPSHPNRFVGGIDTITGKPGNLLGTLAQDRRTRGGFLLETPDINRRNPQR